MPSNTTNKTTAGAAAGSEGDTPHQATRAPEDAAPAAPAATSKETGETFRQSIPVPKASVGLLIGKEGRSIQNIQKRSGCRIQINDRGHTQFCEEWAYCIIEADAVHKMNIAKQLIVLNLLKFAEIRARQAAHPPPPGLPIPAALAHPPPAPGAAPPPVATRAKRSAAQVVAGDDGH